MKKIVTCLAILTMMTAMVSCGSVDSASESSSTRPTSPSTSASSGTTAASDANGTIAAGGQASDGNSAGNANASGNSSANAGDPGNPVDKYGNSHNSYGYYPVTERPMTSIALSDLAGTWTCGNDTINFYGCSWDTGSFEAKTSAGTITGTARFEYEYASDGNTVSWYNLYDSNEKLFMAFPTVNGIQLTDIYERTTGAHYTRPLENVPEEQEQVRSGDSFVGLWGSGRASLVVEKVANNTFTVYIKWSSSAWESTSWTYENCNYSPFTDTLVCEGGGSCSEYIYADDGTETVTPHYTGSNASFSLDSTGTYLSWSDDKETSDEGMEFVFCQ